MPEKHLWTNYEHRKVRSEEQLHELGLTQTTNTSYWSVPISDLKSNCLNKTTYYHANLLPQGSENLDGARQRKKMSKNINLYLGQVLRRGRHIITTGHSFFIKWEFVPDINQFTTNEMRQFQL